MKKGVVYIIRNPLEDEDIYKVGQTQNTWKDRARSGETFSSEPFELIKEYEVTDRFAAEVAAHKALQEYRVRNEIFKCKVDILKATVLLSIRSYNKKNGYQDSKQHDWLIKFINEFPIKFGHIERNCGLCRAGYIAYAIEFMMRATTNPIGLSSERRIEHNKRCSELMSDEKVGSILKEAMKNMNITELIDEEDRQIWLKLNFIFALDSEKGFLFSDLILTPFDELDVFEQQRQRRNYRKNQGEIVVRIKNFNINEIVAHWSEHILIHDAKMLKYCLGLVNNKEYGFVIGAKISVTKAARIFFEQHFHDETLDFFRNIGLIIMGNEFPVYQNISREFGEEDFQNKQKFLELYKKKERIHNQEQDKIEKERKKEKEKKDDIEIKKLMKNLNIREHYANVLVKMSPIFDNQYYNQHYINVNKDKLSYQVKDLEVILYARDNKCMPLEAIEKIYQQKDRKIQEQIAQERKAEQELKKKQWNEWLLKNKAIIESHEKIWNIDKRNIYRILNGISYKAIFGFRHPDRSQEEKAKGKLLLEKIAKVSKQNQGILNQTKEFKLAIENYITQNGYKDLGLKVKIREQFSICDLYGVNNERLATLKNIDTYELWHYGDFPYEEGIQFNSQKELLKESLCVDKFMQKKLWAKKQFTEKIINRKEGLDQFKKIDQKNDPDSWKGIVGIVAIVGIVLYLILK